MGNNIKEDRANLEPVEGFHAAPVGNAGEKEARGACPQKVIIALVPSHLVLGAGAAADNGEWNLGILE